MKKSELKELIKPIVRECVEESVRELVLESGLLSAVIREVLKGTGNIIGESKIAEKPQKVAVENEALQSMRAERQAMLQEMKQKSLSMKVGGVDVFKGTVPSVAESRNAATPPAAANPLGGISPNDPGVDISRLFGGKKFTI